MKKLVHFIQFSQSKNNNKFRFLKWVIVYTRYVFYEQQIAKDHH